MTSLSSKLNTPANIFNKCTDVFHVEEPVTAVEWAEKHFRLAKEATNDSGIFRPSPDQVAILNSMGNDALEIVDVMCPTRFGKTILQIITHNYMIAHKKRNLGFYQPGDGAIKRFVKSKIEPHITNCNPVYSMLKSHAESSRFNTQSLKAFHGCNAFYLNGGSASSY